MGVFVALVASHFVPVGGGDAHCLPTAIKEVVVARGHENARRKKRRSMCACVWGFFQSK